MFFKRFELYNSSAFHKAELFTLSQINNLPSGRVDSLLWHVYLGENVKKPALAVGVQVCSFAVGTENTEGNV